MNFPVFPRQSYFPLSLKLEGHASPDAEHQGVGKILGSIVGIDDVLKVGLDVKPLVDGDLVGRLKDDLVFLLVHTLVVLVFVQVLAPRAPGKRDPGNIVIAFGDQSFINQPPIEEKRDLVHIGGLEDHGKKRGETLVLFGAWLAVNLLVGVKIKPVISITFPLRQARQGVGTSVFIQVQVVKIPGGVKKPELVIPGHPFRVWVLVWKIAEFLDIKQAFIPPGKISAVRGVASHTAVLVIDTAFPHKRAYGMKFEARTPRGSGINRKEKIDRQVDWTSIDSIGQERPIKGRLGKVITDTEPSGLKT